jgi:hypothetical protein
MNILVKIYLFLLFLFLDAFVGMFYDFIPMLQKFDTYKRILCEFGLISLALISFRKESKIYLHLFFAVIFVAVISTLNNKGISIFNFINGIRDFVPMFFSIIFIVNMLHSSKKNFFIQKMNSFIALFLLLNVPASVLQFLAFGGDYVGGTVGWGGSGNLSILIYLCTFCILMQNFNENRILQSLWKSKWLFLLWIPSFINETKVTVLLISLFFVLLLKINLKNILLGTLAVLLSFIGFINLYTYIYNTDLPKYIFIYDHEIDFEDSIGKLENTRIWDRENLWDSDSRTLRLVIGYILMEDKIDWLIGKGLGHFKGSNTSQTKLAKENEYLVKGSISFILLPMLQIGIIGTIFIYWTIFKSCFCAQNSRVKLFLTAVALGIAYYIVCFVSFYFCAIFFYAALSPKFSSKKDFTRQFNFLKNSYLPEKTRSLTFV